MRKAYIIIFFSIILLIISVATGYYIYQITKIEDENIDGVQIALEEVEDECTEEGKALIEEQVILTNAEDIKVSPNATLVIKKYYKTCGHITKDYSEIPKEIVNFTEKEVQEFYKDWELRGFSNGEIVLYKEVEGSCNEHYILREKDGFVVIYNVDEAGNETVKEETKISTEYLPYTDGQKLKEGIKAFGKEELNSIIEDFE